MNGYRALLAVLFCLASVLACEPDGGVRFADFETDADLDDVFWECHNVYRHADDRAGHGKRSLRVELPPGRYPGVMLHRVPRDWRGYAALSFWVFLEGDAPVPAVLRIDDLHHRDDYGQRANIPLVMEPGENRLRFPIEIIENDPAKRRLRLDEMFRIILFLPNSDRRVVLYLDDFRLESD